MQETQYDPAGLELAGLAPPSPGIRGLNNYRFNGKEFQADLGLAWNHQDWRFFDPQLLRWHAGDPEIENGQESWTPYSFGYDNAVRYADADGRAPDDPWYKKALDGVKSVAASVSRTLIKSETVRNEYKDKVSKLDPTDSQGRTQVKVESRAKTPAVTREMAEAMRPIKQEVARAAGTASKSNVEINSTVKTLGTVGKIAGAAAVGIAVYNVATSDNKPKAAAHEGGSLAGAIVGGEVGAEIGASIGIWFGGVGAVPGAVIGGVVGSVVGGIAGGEAGDGVYNAAATDKPK